MKDVDEASHGAESSSQSSSESRGALMEAEEEGSKAESHEDEVVMGHDDKPFNAV